MSLGAIREARRRSQAEVAGELGVKQPTVSKIERQADMQLSTLHSYITAPGGELVVMAQFPGSAPVHITNFGPLKKRKATPAKSLRPAARKAAR